MKLQLLSAVLICALLPLSSYGKNVSIPVEKETFYFVENKGQVTDQYANVRTDIQYAMHANGLDIFIGKGEIHYQFAQAEQNNAVSKKQPSDPEQMPAPTRVNTYRMDVALIGANTGATVVAGEQQQYYNNYRTAGSAGMVTAHFLGPSPVPWQPIQLISPLRGA